MIPLAQTCVELFSISSWWFDVVLLVVSVAPLGRLLSWRRARRYGMNRVDVNDQPGEIIWYNKTQRPEMVPNLLGQPKLLIPKSPEHHR